MAEITLKYAEGYEVCCPLCGTPESQSPVRCPDAQKPGGELDNVQQVRHVVQTAGVARSGRGKQLEELEEGERRKWMR